MKIYLIKPRFPVTYWGFEYSNDLSGVQYTSPPLSLATIAALTPRDIEVEICDENIDAINYDVDCAIVGLTAYLMQGPRAFEIAAEFRKRGKLVVLGGPITGLDAERCKGRADVLFIGEAEYTWPQFLRDYRAGSYQPEYVQTEKVRMEDSPVPRMDLLKLSKYVHATIQTTRGCPFGCEFCDIVVLFGRKVRSKTTAQVIAELHAVAAQRIDSIFFTDDNFIGNKVYAKELLHAIIEFNRATAHAFSYMTQVSINLAKDEELMSLMRQANFNKVFIGIETPRKASLQEVNKGQNLKTDLLRDVQKIQSYNIGVSAGMIVGFDHDDQSIFQEQFDFIMAANIPWAMTGILQAVPKTPLYERLQAEQRLNETTAYFEVDNTALDVNIIPKNMTRAELVKGYLGLIRQLYSYQNYAQRVIGSLQGYADPRGHSNRLPSLAQLKVVWRTLRYFLLTFDSQRRKFFTQIMAYTLRHKPYAVVDAMTYIVSFKHLRAYVYEHLEQIRSQKTAAAFAVASASEFAPYSRQTLNAAYKELRKHATAISQHAATAYDELKNQAADLSKHAAAEYDEWRKQATLPTADDWRKYAAATSQQATLASEELVKHAADIGRHALAQYEELHKQAALAVQQALTAYEELKQHAPSAVQQQRRRSYEELRARALAQTRQASAACEDVRKQMTALSQQIAARYDEISVQAALTGQKAAQVSKHVAEHYKALAEEAVIVRQKAVGFLEQQLENTLATFSLPVITREN